MKKSFPDYIVVEGPIGVGKTSLAKRLASTFNTDLMLEEATENPFLQAFYDNPKLSALPVQLHFLFQRVRQIEALLQTDLFRPLQIADFLLEKDRLFARATLSDDEFELYREVYDRVAVEQPLPDLVIYLQASPEILLGRVLERGIAYERQINEAYLKKIADAYVNFFYHYTASPLLIINTTDFDLVSNEDNYQLLLDHIHRLPPGRHYFNPKQL